MSRFRYALDPLCLLACGLYAANRWVIRPHFSGLFWHGYSTDFLLIPAALPLLLWLYRRLKDVVVCYQCDTVYRDARPGPRQGEVELLKHDVLKYGKTWEPTQGPSAKDPLPPDGPEGA